MNYLVQTVSDMQELLGICPCCGEIFRLVEAKFSFPQTVPRTCEFLKMSQLEYRVSREDERLSNAEGRFVEKLKLQKAGYVQAGRKRAKQKLKKIDPTFSGNDIDPQDVKVIFDPVEYIIFHGLNSENGTRSVEFVSRKPENRSEEKLARSIDHVVRSGNIEFETLHMKDDGGFEIKKA